MSPADLPLWAQAIWAGVIGLLVGSFLNVVVHRVPRKQSIVRPRSSCPSCGQAVRALDNVPVVSWLLLRGRCRDCGEPISWRYPFLESVTGALFVACVARFGFTAEGGVAALFCALMVALAAIDLEHFLLPDRITLPGIAVGLLLQPWLSSSTMTDAIIGTLAGAGVLILLINVWFWLRDEESMGLGDVNMLAMVGAFLGWKGVASTLFFASLSGAIVGIGLVLGGRLSVKGKLPFGFFLALGALASLFFGPELFAWYGERL